MKILYGIPLIIALSVCQPDKEYIILSDEKIKSSNNNENSFQNKETITGQNENKENTLKYDSFLSNYNDKLYQLGILILENQKKDDLNDKIKASPKKENNFNINDNIPKSEYENISLEKAKKIVELTKKSNEQKNINVDKKYCLDITTKVPQKLKEIASAGYSKATIWLANNYQDNFLDNPNLLTRIDNFIMLNNQCSNELNNEINKLKKNGFTISKHFNMDNVYEIQLAKKKTEQYEISQITLLREEDENNYKKLFNNSKINSDKELNPTITQKAFDGAISKINQLNKQICERETGYINKIIYLNSKQGFSSLDIELSNKLNFKFTNEPFPYVSIPISCEVELKNKISQLNNNGFKIIYPKKYLEIYGKENSYQISWK